jgi:membrane protease YdiL (CAAX protease family)
MPMSGPPAGISRFRAYVQFVAAILYYFFARSIAHRAALGLVQDQWVPLAEQAMLVFLLMLGYAAMGLMLEHQLYAVSAQGWPRRTGWQGEAGLGLAVGWALAAVCALALVIDGGIAIVLILQPYAWGWLVADAAFFALAAAAEEVAFRGYGFQRFVDAVGPLGASLGFAALYAIVQSLTPGSNHANIAVSVALSLVLSAAYLRTKALWVSWGLNFGWKASRALIFGLTVSGISRHSPVVQGDPMGPFWLTGGGYGLDGSWFTFFVLIAALPVVFRVTRALDYRYNTPVIVAGGIPVDLDAAARAQHEAAMRTAEPLAPPLVQIVTIASPQAGPVAEGAKVDEPGGSR